jgi:hypothetical protein
VADTPIRHHYRLEISGGHTGSAFRYHSGVFGTLAEVKRALLDELADPQGTAFLFERGCALALEYYEDGALRGAWSAFPALKLRLSSGAEIGFKASGAPTGVTLAPGDDPLSHPVLAPLLEGEAEAEPEVDLGALKLSAPRGVAITRGKAIAIERNGAGAIQAYGWVGGWDERGYKPYRRAERKGARK